MLSCGVPMRGSGVAFGVGSRGGFVCLQNVTTDVTVRVGGSI